jgi:hypothetical protein
MMDLRSIVNAGASVVNPNVTVTVRRSAGYTIGAGQRQVPTYAAPVTGPAQVQALSASDVKQIENLNIQGEIRSLYLRGALAGAVRPESKGGDLVELDGKTWLVVRVLEAWPTWTKAVICLQNPAGS